MRIYTCFILTSSECTICSLCVFIWGERTKLVEIVGLTQNTSLFSQSGSRSVMNEQATRDVKAATEIGIDRCNEVVRHCNLRKRFYKE